MPQTISLAAYSVRIRSHHSLEYIPFNQFEGTRDFKDFINEYINSADVSLDHDSESKRLFRIDVKKIQSTNRIFEGYIETGEYGYESILMDEKGKSRFTRQSNMAEMLPFYFSLWMPKEKSTGILIIQRFGQFGASEAFKKSLSKFLRSTNSKVSIEINQVITSNAIKKILSSSVVKRIIFRKYQMPSDITDYFNKGALNEINGFAEISLVAGRNSELPVDKWLNQMLGKKEIDFLVEEKIDPGKRNDKLIPENREKSIRKGYKSGNIIRDPDAIKVEFGIGNGNRTRTIDLTNLNIFRSYFDVTENVKLDSNGHPNQNSLRKEIESLRIELKELLYPKQDV